jgi:hypothetical protein
MATNHRILDSVAAGVAVASALAGCAELPGIYYQMQLPTPLQQNSCAELARVLADRLSFQITSVSDSFVCTAQLRNVGGQPKMGVGVVLSHDGRMVVDVEEYRWGEWTQPSEATREIGDRVLNIVKGEYPNARSLALGRGKGCSRLNPAGHLGEAG